MTENYSGNVYIVAAPSGGGKTSLVRHLVTTLDDIEISVSHTTRTIRPGETDGVDYYFIREHEFKEMIEEGVFIEHACVFNNLYGTSAKQIITRLNQGIDVVLDIDWQGAQQIRHIFPMAVSIFIIPPSLDELKRRLMNRQQDNEQVISNRMVRAQGELSHYSEFDYVIVNDNFEHAAVELRAIVIANRLRVEKQINKQAKLLSFLLSSQ